MTKRGRMFGYEEAGEFTGLGKRAIERLVHKRAIAFHRVGRRVLIAETDLEAFLDEHRIDDNY